MIVRWIIFGLALVLSACGPEAEKAPPLPTDPAALTQLAKDKQAIGAFEEAIELLDRALAADPKNLPALYSKGAVYEEWDRREDALRAYNALLELDPNHIDALMGLGAVYSKMVMNESAIRYYQRVAVITPDDPKIHFQLALQYWYLQYLEECAEAYRKVIALEPNHVQAHLNIASVYERLKDWDNALKEIAISRQLGKETGNSQAVAIAENKLKFFKGRMNMTEAEWKRKIEPPFE